MATNAVDTPLAGRRSEKRHSRPSRDLPSWRRVVESLPHVVWINAADGSTLFINRKGCELAGLDLEGASKLGWLRIVHPDDAARAERDWRQTTSAGGVGSGQYRFRTRDGGYRWMAVRSVPVPGSDGSIKAWVGTWSDIDDLKRVQEELADANRRSAQALAALDALQATAPVGLGLVDVDYRVVHLNEVLCELNAVAPADVVGRLWGDVVGEYWAAVRPFYDRVLSTGEAVLNVEVHRTTAAGKPSDWLASYYPVRVDDELIGVGLVAVDVTERKLDEEFRSVVMDHMAEGLYALDDRGCVTYVNAAATKMLGWYGEELLGKPMHDLIHFQRVDSTPIEAADCALLKVRSEGSPVRVDYDAFTRKDGSIFPTSYSSAPLRIGGTVRGAVVVFRDTTDEMNEQARLRQELAAMSWVGRIRDALDEDRLVLHAQPIIPAKGGRASEELLIRMVGRSGELVPPGAFLPAAERYGLIREVDQWVTRKAVALAASGRKVEVNLSGASLASPDIVDIIEREVRDSGADPSNLVFEITETALIGDMTAGEIFARRLTDLGCGLALDDFGTGYGSFTYLKRLPISYLKIDIDFVRDLLESPANQHVVRAIVNLAQAFDIRTVAEGVEDQATWDYLRREGVDFGQGFHLGYPVPIDVPPTQATPAR